MKSAPSATRTRDLLLRSSLMHAREPARSLGQPQFPGALSVAPYRSIHVSSGTSRACSTPPHDRRNSVNRRLTPLSLPQTRPPVGRVLSSVAVGHPVGTRSALDRFRETPPHPVISGKGSAVLPLPDSQPCFDLLPPLGGWPRRPGARGRWPFVRSPAREGRCGGFPVRAWSGVADPAAAAVAGARDTPESGGVAQPPQ